MLRWRLPSRTGAGVSHPALSTLLLQSNDPLVQSSIHLLSFFKLFPEFSILFSQNPLPEVLNFREGFEEQEQVSAGSRQGDLLNCRRSEETFEEELGQVCQHLCE